MPTLPGGAQVATQGITDQDQQALTAALQSIAGTNGGTFTQQTETVQQDDVSTTSLSTPLQLNGNTVSNVSTVSVNSGSSGNVLAAIDLSGTSAGSGSGGTVLTNVVADSSLTSVVLTGTAPGNTTALFLDASAGGKVISGDSGNNFLVLGNGADSVIGGTQSNTVVAGIGNDSIIGSSTSDIISSSNGNDIMWGGAGNDSITAGAGNNTLGGGAGNDTLVAGSGGGFQIGEAGNDSLVAGAGKDVMIYSPGDGNDTIVGFNATQDVIGFAGTNFGGSTLDLASLIANAQVAGGNTILTLPDGSTITVAGVTGANMNWFTAK